MTKKILIAILMFSMIDTFAQSFDVVKKVKIYGVSWNMRFVRPIPIKNLKHFSHYNLTLNNDCFPGLEDLFDNYKSCDKYLTAQDTFRSEPRGCVACVKYTLK